jgi:hypothetical protein
MMHTVKDSTSGLQNFAKEYGKGRGVCLCVWVGGWVGGGCVCVGGGAA